MILVLERGTTDDERDAVLADLEALGLSAQLLGGAEKPLVHITAGPTRLARKLIRRHERVEALVPTSGPRIRRQGRRLYPYHFLNWCAAALVLLGVLVLCAGYLPTGVGDDADVQAPLADVPTPWYLRAPARVLALAPEGAAWGGWLAIAAVAAVVLCLPLIDRRAGAHGRTLSLGLGLAILAAYVGLTTWGAF